jgi:hypothetical protein
LYVGQSSTPFPAQIVALTIMPFAAGRGSYGKDATVLAP